MDILIQHISGQHQNEIPEMQVKGRMEKWQRVSKFRLEQLEVEQYKFPALPT